MKKYSCFILGIAIFIAGCGITSTLGDSEITENINYHAAYYRSIQDVDTDEEFEEWFNHYIQLVEDNYPTVLEAREPVAMFTLGYGDQEDKMVAKAHILHRKPVYWFEPYDEVTNNILIRNER
jgi:hypothetical protein